MVDRDFTEIDLRSMLQATTRLRRDIERGRWVAITRLGADRWEVVLEPDQAEERVVVIRLASRTMTDSNSSYLEVTFRHGRALARTCSCRGTSTIEAPNRGVLSQGSSSTFHVMDVLSASRSLHRAE